MAWREPTGLARWKAVDFSEMRIRQGQYVHQPSWFGAFTWCLKHGDHESAMLIKSQQELIECDACGNKVPNEEIKSGMTINGEGSFCCECRGVDVEDVYD